MILSTKVANAITSIAMPMITVAAFISVKTTSFAADVSTAWLV